MNISSHLDHGGKESKDSLVLWRMLRKRMKFTDIKMILIEAKVRILLQGNIKVLYDMNTNNHGFKH